MNEIKDSVLVGYKNFIITTFTINPQYVIDNSYTLDEGCQGSIPILSLHQIKSKESNYDKLQVYKDYKLAYIGLNDFTHYESIVFLLTVIDEIVDRKNVSKFIDSYRINFSKNSEYTNISYTKVSHINSLEIRSKINNKILAHLMIEEHKGLFCISFKLIDKNGRSRLSNKLEVKTDN